MENHKLSRFPIKKEALRIEYQALSFKFAVQKVALVKLVNMISPEVNSVEWLEEGILTLKRLHEYQVKLIEITTSC